MDIFSKICLGMILGLTVGVLGFIIPDIYRSKLEEKLEPTFQNYVEAAQIPNKYGSAQNAILSGRRTEAEVLTSDYNKSFALIPITCKSRFFNPVEGMAFSQNPHKQVSCWWWKTEAWQ